MERLQLNLSGHWKGDHLGEFAQNPDLKTPFDIHIFPNVLENRLVADLRGDVNANVELEIKDNDLYRFKQSKDLRSEIGPKKLTPLINEFVDGIYNQLRTYLEEFSGIELSKDTFDITVSRYDINNYLLCHNDDIRDDFLKASRAFAFVYYLTSRPWNPHVDGGSLILFESDKHGEPVIINNRIMPLTNALVVFPTSPTSWHAVEEVLSDNDPRLSINGWFHSKTPTSPQLNVVDTIEPSPYIFSKPLSLDPRLEEFFTETFNNQYLMSSTCAVIRKRFKQISEINLSNFLVKEKYQEIATTIREAAEDKNNLEIVAPYNKRCYKVLKVSNLPQILQDLYHCFKSELFYMYLAKLTGLDLMPPSLKSRDASEADDHEDGDEEEEEEDFYGEEEESDDDDGSDANEEEDDGDEKGDDDSNNSGSGKDITERVLKKAKKEESKAECPVSSAGAVASNFSVAALIGEQTAESSGQIIDSDSDREPDCKSNTTSPESPGSGTKSEPEPDEDTETDEEIDEDSRSTGTDTASNTSDTFADVVTVSTNPQSTIEYIPSMYAQVDLEANLKGSRVSSNTEIASSNLDQPTPKSFTVSSSSTSSSLDIGDAKDFVRNASDSRDDIRISSTAIASHSGVMTKTAARRAAITSSRSSSSDAPSEVILKRRVETPTSSKEVVAPSPRKRSRKNDPIQRSSFRHLDPGTYTVIHDCAFEKGEKSALDVILHFNHDFGVDFESGGFITYIDTSTEDNPHNMDCELLTIEPKSNSLSLVYRNDRHTCRFLKYMNRAHKNTYQDLYCVYYENPDDLPGSQYPIK